VRAVKARALQIAESGVAIPNWKLVPKRAVRKWLSEDAAPLFLRQHLSDDQIFEKSLRSPRQIELQLPKAKWSIIEPLYQRVSSGMNLVPVTDARQAAQASITTDFKQE
jgi:hypothetical protein